LGAVADFPYVHDRLLFPGGLLNLVFEAFSGKCLEELGLLGAPP
jgi:hypothetical protein